jgi:hypothetical protein
VTKRRTRAEVEAAEVEAAEVERAEMRKLAAERAAEIGLTRAEYIRLLTDFVCTSLRELMSDLEAEAAEREEGSPSDHAEPGDSGPA